MKQGIQYVKINESKSNTRLIEYGVPQGSIIGPLLFIVYTNNLNTLQNAYSFIFSDDTNTFQENRNNVFRYLTILSRSHY